MGFQDTQVKFRAGMFLEINVSPKGLSKNIVIDFLGKNMSNVISSTNYTVVTLHLHIIM